MADGKGHEEIKITTPANLKGITDAKNEISEATLKVKGFEEASKKAEIQLNKTAAAAKTIQTSGGSGLATGGKKSAAQLRAEEMAAGLETERQMRAQGIALDSDVAGNKKYLHGIPKSQAIDPTAKAQADFVSAAKEKAEQRAKDADEREANRAKNIALLRGAAVRVFAVTAAAAAAAAKGLKEYADAEREVAGLDAALAQRGLLSKETREQFQGLANSLSDLTAIDNNEWISALTKLTQFGADSDSITSLATGVENLAGVMGGDLNQASLALGKAMQGNFEQLHRYGIIVPEAATQTEKLDAVLQQAAEKGANQLRAKAESLSGQLAKLSQASNNVLQGIGRLIAGTGFFADAASAASFVAEKLAQKIGGVIPQASSLNNVLPTSSQRLNEVRAAAASAATEFNSVAAMAERANQAMQRQRGAVDALRSAQDQLLDAETQLRLARVDAEEAAQRISGRDATAQRAAIRMGAAQVRFNREQEAERDRIAAAERRQNQIGNALGLAGAQREAVNNRLPQLTQAQGVRNQSAAAQLQVDQMHTELARLQSSWQQWSAEISGGRDENMAAQRAIIEALPAAIARAEQTRTQAGGLSQDVSRAELDRAFNELADAERALLEWGRIRQQEGPGLEDQISNSRLNIDTGRGVFTRTQAATATQTLTDLNRNSPTPTPPAAPNIRTYEREYRETMRLLESIVSNSETNSGQISNLNSRIDSLNRRTANRPPGGP